MRLLGLLVLAVLATVPVAAGPPDWVPRLLSAEEAAEGFYPLFNGENLDGWTIRGDNHRAYAVQDGSLITTGQGNGGWMFTDTAYANFVLRFEYKVPADGGNSGVAIRATASGNPSFTGMEVQIVEPSEPTFSSAGAVYAAVVPQVQADNPAGEWNVMEVLCDGPRIRASLNSQILYDIDIDNYESPDKENAPLSERAREGFIAIQDRADEVAFRNIRIKPLPGGPRWEPLFNGSTLDGWRVVGDSAWSVTEEGLIRIDGKGKQWSAPHSLLHTEATYDDFELKLAVRTADQGNSGVYLRGKPDVPWPAIYEAQINQHDPVFFTGAIFDQAPATELRAADHHWFHMNITARGPQLTVSVNGKVVTEFESPKHAGNESGFIGLQGHNPDSIVEFKDIEIRPLN